MGNWRKLTGARPHILYDVRTEVAAGGRIGVRGCSRSEMCAVAKPFTYKVPDSRAILHALRLYLENRGSHETAALLLKASCELSPTTAYSGLRWGGLSTTAAFYVPADLLARFSGKVRREL